MDLRRALKDEKVPAETVLSGREFQWSMTREITGIFQLIQLHNLGTIYVGSNGVAKKLGFGKTSV